MDLLALAVGDQKTGHSSRSKAAEYLARSRSRIIFSRASNEWQSGRENVADA